MKHIRHDWRFPLTLPNQKTIKTVCGKRVVMSNAGIEAECLVCKGRTRVEIEDMITSLEAIIDLDSDHMTEGDIDRAQYAIDVEKANMFRLGLYSAEEYLAMEIARDRAVKRLMEAIFGE